MKQINGLIILIGSFLFSSQSLAENNSEKIKNECQKVAQNAVHEAALLSCR